MRSEANSRQIKEVSRQFSTRTVEGVESVEKAGTRQRELVNKKWRRNPNGLRKVQKGRIAPNGKCIKVSERTAGEKAQTRLRCAPKSSSRRNAEWNLKSTILRGVR
jgi:hypothetical protein